MRNTIIATVLAIIVFAAFASVPILFPKTTELIGVTFMLFLIVGIFVGIPISLLAKEIRDFLDRKAP